MKFKIEKGISMVRNPTKNDETYPFDSMDVGDSFLVPKGERSRTGITTAAYLYGKILSKKFATRTCPEGTRVWRIE